MVAANANANANANAATTTSPASSTECNALCTINDQLHCGTPHAECETLCSAMLVQPSCGKLTQAFLGCAATQPSTQFECDEGMAALAGSACEAEQAAVVRCFGAG